MYADAFVFGSSESNKPIPVGPFSWAKTIMKVMNPMCGFFYAFDKECTFWSAIIPCVFFVS